MAQAGRGRLHQLLDDILAYTDYLKSEHQLQITMHCFDSRLPGLWERILPYNVHENPFCTYLKSNPQVWEECVRRQEKTIQHACAGPYFGTCWAGMGEYIFPVYCGEQEVAGFVSVSGYQGDLAKKNAQMDRLSRQYGLNRQDMERLYALNARAERPSMERVRLLVAPLCHQLTLLFALAENFSDNPCAYITNSEMFFSNIKRYLERHAYESISLGDLARLFHCSTSYLSRVFREHAHMSFRAYVNSGKVRMAKIYLDNTQLSIQEITALLGFSDANYFSTVFRRETGQSPRAYRQRKDEC